VSFDIRQANGLSESNLAGLPTTEFQYTPDELDLMAGDQGRSRSGWESLGAVRLVLLAAAIAGVALLAAVLTERHIPRVAVSLVALLGVVAVVLILYRALNPPDLIAPDGGGLIPAGAEPSIGVKRGIGLWLGLLASIGIAAGGFLALSGGLGRRSQRRPRPRASSRSAHAAVGELVRDP
jgi:hypothetical protein